MSTSFSFLIASVFRCVLFIISIVQQVILPSSLSALFSDQFWWDPSRTTSFQGFFSVYFRCAKRHAAIRTHLQREISTYAEFPKIIIKNSFLTCHNLINISKIAIIKVPVIFSLNGHVQLRAFGLTLLGSPLSYWVNSLSSGSHSFCGSVDVWSRTS